MPVVIERNWNALTFFHLLRDCFSIYGSKIIKVFNPLYEEEFICLVNGFKGNKYSSLHTELQISSIIYFIPFEAMSL